MLALLLRGARGRPWTFKVGVVLLTTILLILLLTPWIAPYDPAAQDLTNRLAGPSAEHWFGTDHLGRDVLSRLMWGGRFSVTIAAITLVICAVHGIVIGAVAARRGGWFDELVMRTVDVLICFPDVVVALFLIAIFGTGYGTLIVALTITGWTPFARLMRGLALEINSKDFVEAAEILGSPKAYIVFRHVIPNAIRPVLAMGFLRFGHKLITVGALSYLGLGVQPPDSDWGAMLLDAQPYMERAPEPGHPARRCDLPDRAQRDDDRSGPGSEEDSAEACPDPSAGAPASRPELDEGRRRVTSGTATPTGSREPRSRRW